MLLPIKDAIHRISKVALGLSDTEKRILEVGHPFSDPNFELSPDQKPYVYEGIRRLFAERFLYAVQFPNGVHREIGFFEWENELGAFQILSEGFYVNESIYLGSIDVEPYPIYVHDLILSETELKKMFQLVLAFSQPLDDRISIFSNMCDTVFGTFEPTDPGIPKWGMRLCDAFNEYLQHRFSDHGSQEQFVNDILPYTNELENQETVSEGAFASEMMRRESLANKEMVLALATGELSVLARTRQAVDPVSIPPAIWWVTDSFSDVTAHQVIHVAPEDRLSAYNGASPFLDSTEFQSWLQGVFETYASPSNKKRSPGRKKGAVYYSNDHKHVAAIKSLLDSGEAATFAAAFRIIETDVLGLSSDSKRKRLQAKFNARYPEFNGN